MRKRIGIIGAGFAGISTARVFNEFGHDVVVYEKEPDIGGVWSSARRYPGLTTQNPRDTYHLSEMRMPREYPEWPAGHQVQEYMEDYSESFGILDKIRTNAELKKAQWNEGQKNWTLQLNTKNSKSDAESTTDTVDYLIVCNGIFSKPFIPDFPGVSKFKAAGGKVFHTSEFTNIADAEGKNVIVVGYGKSSCDVAHKVMSVSNSTTVVARNLIWKIPKKIMNRLNFKHLFLTRMGEGLFKYIKVRGFEKFLHSPLGLPIRNSMLGTVESIVAKQFRLKEIGLHPNKPLETIARSTVSLVTDGFYEAITSGAMGMKKNASIVELSEGLARLSTGETIPADIIICGTGWHQEAPFFDEYLADKITDSEGNFRLYRSMIPVGVENLAFNGYNSSFFSQLNCEIGALWLIDYLGGGLQLPSEDDQNYHIDKRLAWMKWRTDGKYSKGTNIIPFSMHNIDELLNDMRLNVNVFRRFSQWLIPVDPSQYRYVIGKLKNRYKNAS